MRSDPVLSIFFKVPLRTEGARAKYNIVRKVKEVLLLTCQPDDDLLSSGKLDASRSPTLRPESAILKHMESTLPVVTFSSEDVESAISRLDREIESLDSEVKERRARRDDLRKALDLIRATVLSRPQISQPVVIRTKRTGRGPDDTEQRIIDAVRELGRFSVSRDIAVAAHMDSKAMSRITPRMRLRGLLVAHPLADPNGKFHFPLGLPEFLDGNGSVKPENEYVNLDKLQHPQ